MSIKALVPLTDQYRFEVIVKAYQNIELDHDQKTVVYHDLTNECLGENIAIIISTKDNEYITTLIGVEKLSDEELYEAIIKKLEKYEQKNQ